jgi:hypothetical protein
MSAPISSLPSLLGWIVHIAFQLALVPRKIPPELTIYQIFMEFLRLASCSLEGLTVSMISLGFILCAFLRALFIIINLS